MNVQHFATASASPPFNMSCLGSSLAQILATGSADLPDTSGTIPAPLLIAWMVTFVLMMLPKALSGLGRLIRSADQWKAAWPSMASYVLPVMVAAYMTLLGAHMSYLLLTTTAGSATDRLFASVYGPAPINVWRPVLVVLRLLLIPFGLVSGHLEYVPPGDDGDAIYMMHDSDPNDWDARKYPKARPFGGQKGVPFENFVRDFGAAISAEGDGDSDLEQTMLGEDIGGDVVLAAAAAAHAAAVAAHTAAGGAAGGAGPAPVGPTPPTAAQRARRATRLRTLYSHLYRHITDLRLREIMHMNHNRDGRAAFQMLEAQCRERISDLEMFKLNAEWENASITKSVGIHADSILSFQRFLNGLNARRPVGDRKDDTELTKKLLGCITPAISPTLANDAHKELRAGPAERRFHVAATGHRDFVAACQEIDELWRNQFNNNMITPAAAQRAGVRPDGARVIGDADDDGAYIVGGGAGGTTKRVLSFAEMRGQPICWICRGFGHLAEVCPSAKDVIRPLGHCIDMLRGSIRYNGKGGKGGKGKGKGGRGGYRGGGRGNAAYTLSDNGEVYNADGEYVCSLEEWPSDAEWPATDAPVDPQPQATADTPTPSNTVDDEANLAFDFDYDDRLDVLYEDSDDDMPALVSRSDSESDALTALVSDSDSDGDGDADVAPSVPTGLSVDACDVCLPEYVGCEWCKLALPFDCTCDIYFDGVLSSGPPGPPASNSSSTSRADHCDADAQPEHVGAPRRSSRRCSWLSFLVTVVVAFLAALSSVVSVSTLGGVFTSSTATFASPVFSPAIWAGRFKLVTPDHLGTDAAFMANESVVKADGLDLIVDCGATKTCVPSINFLYEITDASPCHPGMRVGDGTRLPVTAIGKMRVLVKTKTPVVRKKKRTVKHGTEQMHLSGVHVVPKLKGNLLSTKFAFTHDGIRTYLNDQNELVLPSGSHVPFKESGMHHVVESVLATADATGDECDLIHQRLAHFSVPRINAALHHNSSLGISGIQHDPKTCEACMLNATRKPVPKASSMQREYTHFGQRVCSDISGPYPPSPQGFQYAINFFDCKSKVTAVYYMKGAGSDEICLAFQTFQADHKQYLTETVTPGVVDEWFSDNGPGFVGNTIEAMCAEIGTTRSFSAPYTPTRNANAERSWYTVKRPTRTMMAHRGNDVVAQSLWPFCMTHACNIHNSLPTRSHTPPMAPWDYIKPGGVDLSKYRVWGCDCYCTINDHELPSSLASTRIKAVHLGYDWRSSSYFVYIPELRRITRTVNIDFDEHNFTVLGADAPRVRIRAPNDPRQLPAPVVPSADVNDAPLPTAQPARPAPPVANAAQVAQVGAAAAAHMAAVNAMPVPAAVVAGQGDDASFVSDAYESVFDSVMLADAEVVHRSSSVGELVGSTPSAVGKIPIPNTAQQAIDDPIYGQKWLAAMKEDIEGKFIVNQSWDLVTADKIPAGRKVMKGKWVFKVEYNDDGSVKRFKARWVGCGYSQIAGVDYGDVFASTVARETVFCFLAGVCIEDLDMEEGDVVKAFTQGEMDEFDQYVEQPHKLENPKFAACKLKRPLEGTKQAAALFANTNAAAIKELGFSRSMADPNLYWKTVNGTTIRLIIYVDNILTAFPKTAAGRALNEEFQAAYAKRFKYERRGVPTRFMGIEIKRDRANKKMSLTQGKYIREAADKWLPRCARSFSSPVASSQTNDFMKISTASDDVERAAMADKPYLSLMGSLLWAQVTHPETAYYTNFLCQFMHDPSIAAWDAGLAVLAYLLHAKDIGINFDGNVTTVVGFSDNSWGQAPIPYGGHVIFVAGAAVSVSARKLKIVPQSSAEAEYAAYSIAVRDLKFVSQILGSDGFQLLIGKPLTCYSDNTAAIDTIKQVGVNARNRHYDRWLHFGREMFLEKFCYPDWVGTKLMVADVFTKALDKTTFLKFRAALLNLDYEGYPPELHEMIH